MSEKVTVKSEERSKTRDIRNNVIPPITDPMGSHWEQPDTKHILIDDTHAVMSEATFQRLAEYSGTMPSGVYPGKMWRRHNGLYDEKCKPEDRHWLLGWYGIDPDPDYCTNNWRKILLLSSE